MKTRYYYVTVSWRKSDNTSGILSCQATALERNLSMTVINRWTYDIKRMNNFDTVIITNIIPIKGKIDYADK